MSIAYRACAAACAIPGGAQTKTAGGCPAASYLLLRRQKKVTQEKATPVCRRYAVPCVARLVRRLRNSRYALRQSSPTPPDQPALLGGAQGKESQKPNPKTSEAGNARLAKTKNVRVAHTTPAFQFPCAPPSSADQTGEVRRICLSTWPRSGSCEFMRRPGWLSNGGNRVAAANRGRLLFGYFFLAKQEKVTSCRATPGGF